MSPVKRENIKMNTKLKSFSVYSKIDPFLTVI